MKKNKMRNLTGILILAVLIFSGCNKDDGISKDELKIVVSNLSEELDVANDKIYSLENTVESYKKASGIEEGILIRDLNDGSSRTTFVTSKDGKLIFPDALEIEGLTKVPNTSRIIIGENVSISPSNNWVTVSDGSTLYLNHPESIRGVIKLARTVESLKVATYDESLARFVKNFPSAEVVYSDIFLNDANRGRMAKINTFVNDKPSQIVAFVMSSSSVVTIGCFEYQNDLIKDELVYSLLRTLSYSNNSIRIES